MYVCLNGIANALKWYQEKHGQLPASITVHPKNLVEAKEHFAAGEIKTCRGCLTRETWLSIP